MGRIERGVVNGYLDIVYGKDGFIEIRNIQTGCEIKIHRSVLKVITKTVKENDRYEKREKNLIGKEV